MEPFTIITKWLIATCREGDVEVCVVVALAGSLAVLTVCAVVVAYGEEVARVIAAGTAEVWKRFLE